MLVGSTSIPWYARGPEVEELEVELAGPPSEVRFVPVPVPVLPPPTPKSPDELAVTPGTRLAPKAPDEPTRPRPAPPAWDEPGSVDPIAPMASAKGPNWGGC